MLSARKRSLLAEFDRAPGDRQSRIALRAFLSGGQPLGPPAAATAAVHMNTNRGPSV
jgi:hypothetical protein